MPSLTTYAAFLFGATALFGCSSTVTKATGGAGGAASTTGTSSTKATTGTTATNGTTTATNATNASVTTTTNASVTTTGTGASCSPPCGPGFSCCNGTCVNEQNDPHNCGGCNKTCSAPAVLCENSCVVPACTVTNCAGTCCGDECCTGGQICCDVNAGPSTGPKCFAPVMGTCPVGCPACVG